MKVIILGVLVLALAITWAKPVKKRSKLYMPYRLEGDVMVPIGNEDRNAIPTDEMRWPGGVIPYVIDEDVNPKTVKLLLTAFKYLSKKTCLKFVDRTAEKDYVRIHEGEGCTSWIGRVGGKQKLSLQYDGCSDIGSVFHELLHAVGFHHEHRRWDRDDYLIIYFDRILKSEYRQFRKNGEFEERRYTPFDFDSIMLYGPTSFAINEGEITMEARDGREIGEIEDKEYPSKSDIKRINLLYQCSV